MQLHCMVVVWVHVPMSAQAVTEWCLLVYLLRRLTLQYLILFEVWVVSESPRIRVSSHSKTPMHRVQYKLAVTVHRCLPDQASTDVPHRLLRTHDHIRDCCMVRRQPPSTDCSTCPLQQLRLSLLLVPQSGIHCLTICAIQLLDRNSFDGIWNPPVCLLLAFRWQCVRGVFT